MSKVLLGFLVLAAIFGFWGVSSYNKLVKLDQGVQAQWSQVENVYQRRADLVPNLVETVKGAAKFEKDTFTAVTEARAKVGQVQGGATSPNDPASVQKFADAQQQLSTALSRLMVVVERYPELKSDANFRDLQAQLEGTENRIAIARRDYNEAVRDFNTSLRTFPTVIWAKTMYSGSQPMQLFQATSAAQSAPSVNFGAPPVGQPVTPGSAPPSTPAAPAPAQ